MKRLDLLLLAAVATATWHRLAWAPLGRLTLTDLLQEIGRASCRERVYSSV